MNAPLVITPRAQDDLDRSATAADIQWDESMMLFHPLLEGNQYNGFYPTPEDLAEALESVDCEPKYKVWGFATTRTQGRPILPVGVLIASAAHYMPEGWQEYVMDEFGASMDVIQGSLDVLSDQIAESYPVLSVDYSRVVLLPVGVTVVVDGEFKEVGEC